MKKLVSMVTMVLMLSLLMNPMIGTAKKTSDIFKVKKFGKYSQDMNGISKMFMENKAEFDVEAPEAEFSIIRETMDSLGYKHIKLQQMVDNIPVYGNEYIVHYDATGEVYAVNGRYDILAKNYGKHKNFINPNKAVKIAEDQVTFDRDSLNQDLPDNLMPKLYLYNVDNSYVPVYLVRVNFLSPEPGDWNIFVNAYTGDIVFKQNVIANVATTITGKGVLGDTKTLNADLVTVKGKRTSTTQYQLVDATRATTITTYNCANGTRLPGTVAYSETTTINDPAATDAHYYAGNVYDYYKAKFNRNSLNGSGMAIKSSVHYSRNYNNAFWNGSQMVYGDGDGRTFAPLSGALDVIGHEMTHGVNSYEAKLIYQNQSGALSESFSDVMGTFIEYYAQPLKFDWQCGEDIWTPGKGGDALRDLQNPASCGDPDHMSKYVNTTSDYGGVHTNCGIPNKAAYNFVTGLAAASGYDLAIAIQKAEQIYYKALCDYMTSSCTFSQARAALVQAANNLFSNEPIIVQKLNAAFDAVGIN